MPSFRRNNTEKRELKSVSMCCCLDPKQKNRKNSGHSKTWKHDFWQQMGLTRRSSLIWLDYLRRRPQRVPRGSWIKSGSSGPLPRPKGDDMGKCLDWQIEWKSQENSFGCLLQDTVLRLWGQRTKERGQAMVMEIVRKRSESLGRRMGRRTSALLVVGVRYKMTV